MFWPEWQSNHHPVVIKTNLHVLSNLILPWSPFFVPWLIETFNGVGGGGGIFCVFFQLRPFTVRNVCKRLWFIATTNTKETQIVPFLLSKIKLTKERILECKQSIGVVFLLVYFTLDTFHRGLWLLLSLDQQPGANLKNLFFAKLIMPLDIKGNPLGYVFTMKFCINFLAFSSFFQHFAQKIWKSISD